MNLTNTCNVRQGPQPELQGTHSLPMIEPDLHSPREHTGELGCQHDGMKTSAHLLSSWTSETLLKKTNAFKFKAFGNRLEAKSNLVKKTFESSEFTSFVTEHGEIHTQGHSQEWGKLWWKRTRDLMKIQLRPQTCSSVGEKWGLRQLGGATLQLGLEQIDTRHWSQRRSLAGVTALVYNRLLWNTPLNRLYTFLTASGTFSRIDQ